MCTRTLVQEIDDIRAGRWDNKIRTDLGLPSEENDATPAEPPATAEAAVEIAEPPQPPSLEMKVEEAAEDGLGGMWHGGVREEDGEVLSGELGTFF